MGRPDKPWVLLEVTDRPGMYYRFAVVGENHCFDPPERFYWSVPDLDDPRYDASKAVYKVDEKEKRA